MSGENTLAKRFGEAWHGVQWAAGQVKEFSDVADRWRVAGEALELKPYPAAKGQDDYAVQFRHGKVTVLANTAVGAISGLLALAEAAGEGRRKNLVGNLRFTTRNYKLELPLANPARGIAQFTEAAWEALCRQIVAHQFNGLVLYAGYHPFEHFLDYKQFRDAPSRPAAERAAVRAALRQGLQVAHRYGLKTFLHHYVGHFTPALAAKHDIRIAGRLASIDHPAVEKYCRYCYHEIFRQVPELDGLYFNFESSPSSHEHVLKTAIPEFNSLKTKPIAVFRLWGFTDPDGMRAMLRAYRGRVILGHKIADTNDTYYYPVADSRVTEWKKLLGKAVEWMFLVGPCHNCGTNIQNQLWADYDFVQTILADAQAKGADSISFHASNDMFAPEIAAAGVGGFGRHERAMASFNCLHVEAVTDYVNGRQMLRRQRAAFLARRVGVPATAAGPLLEAIEASSQLVLLTFQQFCYGSAFEGYLNPGRHTHIQDPFMYFPATACNNQASGAMWAAGLPSAWIPKSVDTLVTPNGFLQYIIDYADPAGAKATRDPAKLAALLRTFAKQSLRAVDEYRKAAGRAAGDELEFYVRQNAALGEYVRHEILAAIWLYGLYFARTKPVLTANVRKGLAELKAAAAIVVDRQGPTYRSMARVTMLNLNIDSLVAEAEAVHAALRQTHYPLAAFLDFVESHRLYNEIRRVVRPCRQHDAAALAVAAGQLDAALARADSAWRGLLGRDRDHFGDSVKAWLWFLHAQRAMLTPPQTPCPAGEGEAWIPLVHEHCFRMGENFLEDFAGFFRPIDYLRPSSIAFQCSHTAKELVIRLREQGVDVPRRRARWQEYRNSGSDCFVERIFVDVGGAGAEKAQMFTVWPEGQSVSRDREPGVAARTEFASDEANWQVTTYLPFALLGRRPQKGESWGLNVTSNPSILRNAGYTWAMQYDSGLPNAALFGRIQF